MPVADVTEQVISMMVKTKNNNEFIDEIDNFVKKFKQNLKAVILKDIAAFN